jgi:hypothetical protein
VLKAIEVRSGRVTNPGTHSTSNDPEHHEDVSDVDKLVVKFWKEHHEHKDHALAARLDKAAQDALIQSASNSLAPPPPPLPTTLEEINMNELNVRNGLSSLEGGRPPMISPVFDEPKNKKPPLSVAVTDNRDVLVQHKHLISSVNTLLSEVCSSVNQKRYFELLDRLINLVVD